MLRTDLVIGPDHRPFEQAPDVLNPVRVDIATDPFFLLVIDGLMPRILVGNPLIGRPFVRDNQFGVGRTMLFDELMERFAITRSDLLQPDLPATLGDADDQGFVLHVVPRPASLAAQPAADKGFVNLDRAVELRRVVLGHGGANPVAEIPGRLVGDAEHALDLVGRHPFLGLHHEIDRYEPFLQWQMGIVEDRAGRDRELVAA